MNIMFRETAPSAAHRDMFVNNLKASTTGTLSIGEVRLWEENNCFLYSLQRPQDQAKITSEVWTIINLFNVRTSVGCNWDQVTCGVRKE